MREFRGSKDIFLEL